jgi:hypothetical protein
MYICMTVGLNIQLYYIYVYTEYNRKRGTTPDKKIYMPVTYKQFKTVHRLAANGGIKPPAFV